MEVLHSVGGGDRPRFCKRSEVSLETWYRVVGGGRELLTPRR